jgi:hypothetical protein
LAGDMRWVHLRRHGQQQLEGVDVPPEEVNSELQKSNEVGGVGHMGRTPTRESLGVKFSVC